MKRGIISESLRMLLGGDTGTAVEELATALERLAARGAIRVLPAGQFCGCEPRTGRPPCIDQHGLEYLVALAAEREQAEMFRPIVPPPAVFMGAPWFNRSQAGVAEHPALPPSVGCIMQQIGDVIAMQAGGGFEAAE